MIGTNKLPTKGDEQVVDLDLDKDTVVKSAKIGYTPVNSRSHWEGELNVASGKKAKPRPNDSTPPVKVEVTIPSKHSLFLCISSLTCYQALILSCWNLSYLNSL